MHPPLASGTFWALFGIACGLLGVGLGVFWALRPGRGRALLAAGLLLAALLVGGLVLFAPLRAAPPPAPAAIPPRGPLAFRPPDVPAPRAPAELVAELLAARGVSVSDDGLTVTRGGQGAGEQRLIEAEAASGEARTPLIELRRVRRAGRSRPVSGGLSLLLVMGLLLVSYVVLKRALGAPGSSAGKK